MNTDPLFSIVINNYNYGRYINDAIDSALAQTYRPTEVVVVDDGSTDDSRDRIESYGEQLVTVFQENQGQTTAMNVGFTASRGEYVIFLDADDILGLDVAEQAAANFLEDPKTVLVHWQMNMISGDGSRIGETMPQLLPDEGAHLRELILTYGPNSFRRVPTSGTAWHRNYLESVSPFPLYERKLGLSSASVDAYLSTLAPLLGNVRRLPEPSGGYRVHGKNSYATSTFDSKISRLLKLYGSHCEELDKLCHSLGLEYSKALWGSRSWPHLIDRAVGELREVMDLSQPFALIDEMQWAMDATPQRQVIPFPERDGVYWGRPANSQDAIDALERLRSEGAKAVVVAWPAYWWLDHYRAFAEHLRKTTVNLIENERVIAFDLTSNPATD